MSSQRIWLAGCLGGVLAASLGMPARAAQSTPQAQAPVKPESATVNGGAGPCTADFNVTDSSGQGLYGAKIDIQVRYGFMGLHKLGVTIKTDAQGKAHIDGLPDKIKPPAEFTVALADQTKMFVFDPLMDCHPKIPVIFTGK